MSETTKKLRGEEYIVTHSVGHNRAGYRLDRFLMERYKRRSREQLKKAIDSGSITVIRKSGKGQLLGKIKASFSLQQGDIVQVLSIRRAEPAVDFNYKILMEDEGIFVIAKPANLPVHPAGRFFFNTLLIHLKTNGFTQELESERQFFLVHRIDKETSGVLLLAKTKESCNALTGQFRNRETDKYYLAIVKGAPHAPSFDIDHPIGKIPGSKVGLKMYPRTLEQGGLASLTHFELVETRTGPKGTFSLMACFPRTGRQHQIRVHAELAGIPLVGDKLYGMSDDDSYALIEGHREGERSMNSPEPLTGDEDLPTDEEMGVSNDEIPDELPEEDDEVFEIPGPTSSLYAELEAKLILPRHALHAAGLRFRHPLTGKMIEFESDLPEDLRSFFESIDGRPLASFKTKHW